MPDRPATSNPAQALLLPRRPQRLPRTVLSEAEVEQVLAQPDLTEVLGLRNRAILEVLYSTGIRRLELIQLTLPDVDPERGFCFVREGKGQKDRMVPIGTRALGWIERYLAQVRPLLVVPPDGGTLFLSRRGRPLATNRLSELVHRYVAAAGFPSKGSCHVFRHTMATLLLKHGADIRHIQAILGHADLRTTARYTHVVIDELKAVHQRTHPAERVGAPDGSQSVAAGSEPAMTSHENACRVIGREGGPVLKEAVSQKEAGQCVPGRQ